jgi:hypothetical protein
MQSFLMHVLWFGRKEMSMDIDPVSRKHCLLLIG